MARTIESEHAYVGYSSVAFKCPKISRELESEYAQRWRRHQDTVARDLLVRSQLRHVIVIARRYRRETCATLEELIAEGNFGLLQALEKFEPERGTRFITYAVYWIRAYIWQYVLRSRSLVATGIQSKHLSRIRNERAKIALSHGERQSADDEVARKLALSPERWRSLIERLEVRDVSWEDSVEESSGRFDEVIQAQSHSAEEAALFAESSQALSRAISSAVSKLDTREKYVVERRVMADSDEQLSLADIARSFGISRERARQIEARAIRKVRVALGRSGRAAEWLAERAAA